MKKLGFLLTASLSIGACGSHEARAMKEEIPTSSALKTETSSSDTATQTGSTQPTNPESGKPSEEKPTTETPAGETPATETPVEDDTLPILSIDGKARVLALAEIAAQYDAILSINPDEATKAKSVTKAFATFDKEALVFIQAMEKLPAHSSKRKVLLGQLKTLAAKLYDHLSTLNEILPNTQENADAILAAVATIDAFRSI